MKQVDAISFFRAHTAGNLQYLLGDAWCSDRILKLYRLIVALNGYGMTGRRITCGSCRFFRDERIRELFEAFLTPDLSLSAIPLESVIIRKQVGSNREWNAAWRDISSSTRHIALYRERYNVGAAVEMRIRAFDAKTALKLCDLIGNGGTESIDFRFDFPPVDGRLTRALMDELDEFCRNLSSRNSKVSLSNLPFCFVPPDSYRYLYNRIVAPMLGAVDLQRRAITDLKRGDTGRARCPRAREKTQYFSGCLECRCRLACYTFTETGKHPAYQPFLSAKRPATIAFAGERHLPESDARRSDILYTFPARQGDMFMAVLEGFQNILLIDGGGHGSFPCTTFEVMLAIENGVNVLGSSGTGALRAVELDVCGMRGAGYVYRYLRRQRIKPYHIVTAGRNEKSGAASIPPINIVYFLDRAQHKKLIARNEFGRCVEVAQSPTFTGLTFASFFKRLRENHVTSLRTVEQLERYLKAEGDQAFDIGKKDALRLLGSLEPMPSGRSGHVTEAFRRARKYYLTALKSKYPKKFRPVLPHNWRRPLRRRNGRAAVAAPDGRESSLERTRSSVEAFLRDLDVTLADLSGHGACGGSTVAAVLVPLYFLGCHLCCALGSRDVFDEALVSACMELVERIPMFAINLDTSTPAAAKGEIFPPDQVPQYYNWLQPEEEKQRMVRKFGYVQATDIMSGREVFVPTFAATSVTSGSDGNAAGNSLAEAVLHGVYELIERDIVVTYDYFVCPALQSRLVIDIRSVRDARCRTLIQALGRKRYRPILLNFVNVYGIPCIRCDIYDLNSGMVGRGSTAVNADLNRALFASLSEAYMQCAVYDSGIKDDTIPFSSRSARFLFRQGTSLFSKNSRTLPRPVPPPKFSSVAQEIDYLTRRLAEAGVEHILVVNNSPRERFRLKSVKVMIPGLDIGGVSPFVPSPWLEHKVQRTLSLIADATADPHESERCFLRSAGTI